MSDSLWKPTDWFWDVLEPCGHRLPELRSRLSRLPDDQRLEFQHPSAMASRGGELDWEFQKWVDAPFEKRYAGHLVALIHRVHGTCDVPSRFYAWLEQHWDSVPRPNESLFLAWNSLERQRSCAIGVG